MTYKFARGNYRIVGKSLKVKIKDLFKLHSVTYTIFIWYYPIGHCISPIAVRHDGFVGNANITEV